MNPDVKKMAIPWNPSGWMKNADTAWGSLGVLHRSFLLNMTPCVTYLVQVIQDSEYGVNYGSTGAFCKFVKPEAQELMLQQKAVVCWRLGLLELMEEK